MKEWTEVLADREGLSEEEIHWLTDNQERRAFAKNEIVVHKDEVDSNVYIITKGIWRAYHFKNGEEATAWFATPGELVFSVWGYISDEPSRLSFEAMTESEAICLSKEELHRHFNSSIAMANLGRRMLENFILLYENWLMDLWKKNAFERYLTLLDEYPEVIQQIPMKYIAPGCHGAVLEPHPGIAERNEMTAYHFAQNEQEVKQMNIRFEPVPRNEFGDFKKDVKEIFAIGVIEHFGMPDDGEPVPDRDVDEALYHPKADVFYVYQGNRRVGGVVLTIDKETHRNKMDLFYIYPDCHSRGLGYAVWKQIESMYPATKVWELVTPCFEKRNIHFYVNKCGFHIVEYFNARHKDPDYPDSGYEYRAEYFRFEKLMKP